MKSRKARGGGGVEAAPFAPCPPSAQLWGGGPLSSGRGGMRARSPSSSVAFFYICRSQILRLTKYLALSTNDQLHEDLLWCPWGKVFCFMFRGQPRQFWIRTPTVTSDVSCFTVYFPVLCFPCIKICFVVLPLKMHNYFSNLKQVFCFVKVFKKWFVPPIVLCQHETYKSYQVELFPLRCCSICCRYLVLSVALIVKSFLLQI